MLDGLKDSLGAAIKKIVNGCTWQKQFGVFHFLQKNHPWCRPGGEQAAMAIGLSRASLPCAGRDSRPLGTSGDASAFFPGPRGEALESSFHGRKRRTSFEERAVMPPKNTGQPGQQQTFHAK